MSEEYSSDNVESTHRAIQVGCYILIELESPQRGENRELMWSVLYFKATSGCRIRMLVRVEG